MYMYLNTRHIHLHLHTPNIIPLAQAKKKDEFD